jgi:hypothetical protein
MSKPVVAAAIAADHCWIARGGADRLATLSSAAAFVPSML